MGHESICLVTLREARRSLSSARSGNGRILWANLHLLFRLSLIPFATGRMGENNFAARPVAFYGGVLLSAAIAYFIL